MKRLRQVRQEAKSSLKGISSRLKALVEELAKQYKGKQKLENLRSLQHCGEVREREGELRHGCFAEAHTITDC